MQVKRILLLLCLFLELCSETLHAQLNDYKYRLDLAKQALKEQRYNEALLAIIEAEYTIGADRAECQRFIGEVFTLKTKEIKNRKGTFIPLEHFINGVADRKTRQITDLYANTLVLRARNSYSGFAGIEHLALAKFACAITNNQNISAYELRSDLLSQKLGYVGVDNEINFNNGQNNYALFNPYSPNVIFYAMNDRVRAINFPNVFREDTNLVRRDLRITQQIQHLSFSPNGYLLVCEKTGAAKVYNVNNSKTPVSTVPSKGKIIWGAFLSEYTLIAIDETTPGKIDFYRVNIANGAWSYQKSITPVLDTSTNLGIIAGDNQFLVWSRDSIASIINWEGIETARIKAPAPILNATLMKDGSKIALYFKRGSIHLFDKKGSIQDSLKTLAPLADFKCITFSPDGRYLSAGAEGEVYAWNIPIATQNRYPFVTWSIRIGWDIGNIQFSPDGKRLFWLDESGRFSFTDFKEPVFDFQTEVQSMPFQNKILSGFWEEDDCFLMEDKAMLEDCTQWFRSKFKSHSDKEFTISHKLELLYAKFFAEKALIASPSRQNSRRAAEIRESIHQIDGYFLGHYFPSIPPPTQELMREYYIGTDVEEDNYSKLIDKLKLARHKGMDASTREELSSYFLDLAWKQLIKQDFKGAIVAAKKGLQIDPHQRWGLSNLALAYLLDGDWPKAEKIYTKWQYARWEKSGYGDLEQYVFFNEYFAQDLRTLESANIKHPDFAKLRQLLGLGKND